MPKTTPGPMRNSVESLVRIALVFFFGIWLQTGTDRHTDIAAYVYKPGEESFPGVLSQRGRPHVDVPPVDGVHERGPAGEPRLGGRLRAEGGRGQRGLGEVQLQELVAAAVVGHLKRVGNL